ncbi:MAG: hypothetical protein FWD71_08800 [Oscillospiraceae bacterium]|nr:hypothetical protein [Oscillospiraceae bacterium]
MFEFDTFDREQNSVRDDVPQKKTNKAEVKKTLYIVSLIFFAVIFIVSSIIFYFASYNFAPSLLIIAIIIAGIVTVALSFAVCGIYAKYNSAKLGASENPDDGMDYDKKKNSGYYLKRMYFTIIILVAGSFAFSLIGGFADSIFGGFSRNNITNTFLQGMIIKVPVFVVFMLFIYNMFVKFGAMDAERKVYNFGFKILSIILTFIFMIPNMIFDSMYDTSTPSIPLNVHTVLSPNVDIYHVDQTDGTVTFNSDFNMILVIIMVLLTLAVEVGVMLFAYRRGKKLFMEQRMRKDEEYQTDEKF